jgi:hypothetical protein
MQRLQHCSVTTEDHGDVGLLEGNIPMALAKTLAGAPRGGCAGTDKGNTFDGHDE